MTSKRAKYEPFQTMGEEDSHSFKKHVRKPRLARKLWCFLAVTIILLLALTYVLYITYTHSRYSIQCNDAIPTLTPAPQTESPPPSQDTILLAKIPPPPKATTFKLNLQKEEESLVDTLQKLVFKNYGIVRDTDRFAWKKIPCAYLESQNVTGPYLGWADTNECNYLYRLVGNDLVHPPSGMRSSVPLGGISTGVFELRGDGSFHEWTIFNQHPAGAAKIQLLDDVFMGLRTVVHKEKESESMAFVLQTHPSNQKLPAVHGLEYRGSHPVTKLTVKDTRVPIEASIYAYPWYKHNDMNASATPAVAFTAVLHNPLEDEVTSSFMINLPIGMEPHTQRFEPQMPKYVPIIPPQKYDHFHRVYYDDIKDTLQYENSMVLSELNKNDELECFTDCNEEDLCQSWSYDSVAGVCYMFSDVRMNGHMDGAFSGVKSSWSQSEECVTVNRDTPGYSTNGNMSLCVFSSDDSLTKSIGISDDITTLWTEFSEEGKFSSASNGGHVSGAVSGQVTLKPGETKEVTIVLGWYFPDRDFLGLPVGNYYKHLVKNSTHAAKLLGQNLQEAVSNVSKLHATFFDSDVPVTLQDMLINSLSHIRSAFWLEDGRWRQWEAHDCVNIDSVHNDGERHIPYIMVFPDSVINKMRAWAGFQQADGMIQEQVRCGCQFLPVIPVTVEYGCGRKMSDVSSMFIVYLLELLQWHPDNATNDVVAELWPAAKRAAEWHIDISVEAGMPKHLVTTYDVLGMSSYPYATYNGAFHLLAMKAAEKLAYWMGDQDFAIRCNNAFTRGQEALDRLLWNETAQYYNAYRTTEEEFNKEMFFNYTQLNLCEYPEYKPKDLVLDENGKEVECLAGQPTTPGAIMTDTFYAQVLAYSLGLGTLVKHEDRLKSHMKAELEHNDSPYGMLVVTGRFPYPGPFQDNAVWMMGNPNWATISLHLGEEPEVALEVAKKPFEQWRSVLHEQWNVAGILGGVNYGADGMPFITSHYGYYMSSWHIILALSGQDVDVNEKRVAFTPKLKPPFKLPVMLPSVWGFIQSDLAPTNMSKPDELHVFYTLGVHFGEFEVVELSVGDCKYDHSNGDTPLRLYVDLAARWHCPYV